MTVTAFSPRSFALLTVLLALPPAAHAGAFPSGGDTLTADKTYDADGTWTGGHLNTAGFNATFTNCTTTLKATPVAQVQNGGDVILENNAVFEHATDSDLRFPWDSSDLIVAGGATYRWTGTASGHLRIDGGLLTVEAGGQVDVSLDPAAANGPKIRGCGIFLQNGAEINVNTGVLDIEISGKTGGGNDGGAGTINVAAGARVNFSTFDGQRWGTDPVNGLTIRGAGSIDFSFFSLHTGFVSLETTGTNTWSGGNIEPENGAEFRIASGTRLDAVSTNTMQVNANGQIVVDGLLVHDSNSDMRFMGSADLVVNDGGELRLNGQDGGIRLDTADHVFTLNSGATLTHSHTGTCGVTHGGTIDIKDGATVQALVPGGRLNVRPGTVLCNGAPPSSTLTFSVKINDGTLDIDGMPAGGIATVGANTTLQLSGTNAAFVDAGANMIGAVDTIDGTLSLRDGNQTSLTPGTGTLTVPTSGTLEFGLNAPDTTDPASTTNAYLTVAGACDIADGSTVSIVNSGGLNSGSYALVSAATLNVNPGAVEVDKNDDSDQGWRGSARLKKIDNTLVLQLFDAATVITVY